MIPPAPTETLANCMWLPRILGKARLIASGQLPESFARLFCSPHGMDGVFLKRFELTRDDIERFAALSDQAAARAFLDHPDVTPEKIEAWNRDAPQFGKPGYPLENVFPVALAERYPEVQRLKPQTVFEMLAADDARLRSSA
ncbi:DUF5069 domain-containing protein [Pelagicoccus sp. SDUM812003]|uniref:DUF5069 domain-containing protein n=1 Tax=Pelagicoccus sp. SDUM812003 TaxID=3041267 RepID=UPI00280E4F23|nr:DUF5069 domain-containing protein [Pelagicoccus sp. SDUM812003]MDQ8202944.1 DUF5069 domain-containing protein [Pelagicoccus sp. SDUM812003]